jgi:hypothetical protein
MRAISVLSVLLTAILALSACGWSPPSAPPPQASTCTPGDGPSSETVAVEIAKIDASWREVDRGNTTDCALYWVQAGPQASDAADAPQQVVFFDRTRPVGTATPQPRPYVTVTTTGNTVSVQYQWRQGGDPACCPTGIGTVRFQLVDGRLKALDPIPNG